MVVNFSETNSLLSVWMRQLRDVNVQNDRLRFRNTLERIGAVIGYEISKELDFQTENITTPLGAIDVEVLKNQPVLATILRAGLPLHNGLLNFFDGADSAFMAAYRKHHKDGSFEIANEYLTAPPIDGRPLIISDPMLATGASLLLCVKELKKLGTPSSIHVVTAIAASQGVDYLQKHVPDVHIWACAIDDELTAKGYIVPGLGDAGDLCYGSKNRD